MGCDRALKRAGKCPGASLGRSGEGPSPWERALEERREVCAGAAGGAAAPAARGAGHCAGRQRWQHRGPCAARGRRWEAVLCLRGSHPVLTSDGSDAGTGQLLKRLQSRRHGRITSRGIVCAPSHAVPLRPLEWVLGLKWGRRTEGAGGTSLVRRAGGAGPERLWAQRPLRARCSLHCFHLGLLPYLFSSN